MIKNKILNITNLTTKATLNTKAAGIENQILKTTSFITTPEFKRLVRIHCDASMKQEAKSLAS